ncbi:hypothetical protein K503DRAFT_860973, partial [Rhizopogon vinicolor AM-OR11-026]
MSGASGIIAELEELRQYETYEPIARRLEVLIQLLPISVICNSSVMYLSLEVLTFHHEVDILWNRYFALGAIIVSTYRHAFTNFVFVGEQDARLPSDCMLKWTQGFALLGTSR